MFCTKCGAQIKEGAGFCTKCGAKVEPSGRGRDDVAAIQGGDSSSNAARGDSAGGDATGVARKQGDSLKPKKGRRRVGCIIAVCLALILAVGGAAAWYFLLGPGVPIPFSYGTDYAVEVSRTAHFVPKDEAGSPLEHYLVRIHRGYSIDDEAYVDIRGIDAYEVRDGKGFTPEDVLKDLPDGLYEFAIEEDDGDVLPMPAIIVDEDGNGGTFVVDTDPEKKIGAKPLFLAKLRSMLAQYGSGVEVVEGGASFNPYTAYASGLAYAELVDFGDGVDRLALAYETGEYFDEDGYPTDESYNVEVWEYDESSDRLVCVLGKDGSLHVGTGGDLSYFLLDEQSGARCIGHTVAFTDGDGGYEYRYEGVKDDGTFGTIRTERVEYAGQGIGSQFVDGKEMTEDEYRQSQQDFFGQFNPDGPIAFQMWWFGQDEDEAKYGSADGLWGPGYRYPSETSVTVEDTMIALNNAIAEDSYGEDAGEEAEDEADAQDDGSAELVDGVVASEHIDEAE